MTESIAQRGYARRIVDRELDDLLPLLPAIALEGARGVGKTSTAKVRAKSIIALDEPGRREIVDGDPSLVLGSERPVLIDEWQMVPDTWNRVRRAVDEGAPPSSFLLTGSSSGVHTGTHSGAGRIVIIRMRPFSLAEREIENPTVSLRDLLTGDVPSVSGSTAASTGDYVDEILRSGFPGVRDFDGRARTVLLESYLSQIVDRDFPELGHNIRNPGALRRWMTAYAAVTSLTTSFEKIRAASTPGESDKPSRVATAAYRDVLERLWILDPTPAWQPRRSRISRLTLPLKHHLADPALACALLNMDANSLLTGVKTGLPVARSGTFVGALFESLVTLSMRAYAQAASAQVLHFRTGGGDHEVDLIVERPDGRVLAIEVKFSGTIRDQDVRQLKWLASHVGDEMLDSVVINTGSQAYRRKDGIAVIPAALIGP